MKILDRWRFFRELCGLAAVVWLPVSRECAKPVCRCSMATFTTASRHPASIRRADHRISTQAGIRQALLSSTPNDGIIDGQSGYPQRFIPELRPYRKTRDLATWSIERRSWTAIRRR